MPVSGASCAICMSMGVSSGEDGKLRPARYDRATGEETKMSEKPQTGHHAPAEDRAGLLGKRRPDGRGRARGLHRHRARPRHRSRRSAKAVGISERNAERLLTALTAMTLLTREGDGEQGASPTRPTCSASWSRTASAMPGRGSCSPSRAGRPSANSASACAARRRTGSATTPSSRSTTRGATTPPPTRSAWAPPACSAAASISAAAS